MSRVSQRINRLEVVFDDESLVADGGLLAAGTLMDRLGLEELWDEMLRLGDRVGGANPGRKVLSLVSSMLVGATHIDHASQRPTRRYDPAATSDSAPTYWSVVQFGSGLSSRPFRTAQTTICCFVLAASLFWMR